MSNLFDRVQNKIKDLNSGILNPDNAPDGLGVSDCMELGNLSMLLGASIKDFNNSDKSDFHLQELSNSVDKIEREAQNIINSWQGERLWDFLVNYVI